MEFFFSKIFWGLMVVLFGVSILLNSIFKINIPIFKIALAGFFIFIGVRMLLDTFGVRSKTNFMGDQHVRIEQIENDKYDVVFGSQVIDLTQGSMSDNDAEIECNVVFGSAKILVPRHINLKLSSSAVFGSVRPPSGDETVFGSNEYVNGEGNLDGKTLRLEVNAVFGSATIIER